MTVYLPVLLEPWILSIHDSLLTSYVMATNVILPSTLLFFHVFVSQNEIIYFLRGSLHHVQQWNKEFQREFLNDSPVALSSLMKMHEKAN